MEKLALAVVIVIGAVLTVVGSVWFQVRRLARPVEVHDEEEVPVGK